MQPPMIIESHPVDHLVHRRAAGREAATSVYELLGLEAEVTAEVKAKLGLWDETLRDWRARQ